MKNVVKLLSNDDGEKIDKDLQKWCYVINLDSTNRTLCSGEAFGLGDSESTYKEKPLKPGAITCEDCRAIIKELKAVKL